MKQYKTKIGDELSNEWLFWEEPSFEDHDQHEDHVMSIVERRLCGISSPVITERDVPTLIESLSHWIHAIPHMSWYRDEPLKKGRLIRSSQAFMKKLRDMPSEYPPFSKVYEKQLKTQPSKQ